MTSYPKLICGFVCKGVVYYIKADEDSETFAAKTREGLKTEWLAKGVSFREALFTLASQMPEGNYRPLI